NVHFNTFGTSIMLPAIGDIVKDLHTDETMVNVSVGVYSLSLGIFPIWWSSFLERYGRRTVYLVSFTLFFAFSVGAAFAPNISILIGLRVLQDGCSASVQAVGAGTVSDLFVQQEMGKAMGLYYLGPLLGPFSAPIIGGVVGEVWGWRATQWSLAIVSGVNVMSILLLLPETLRKPQALLKEKHKG
ncbi:MFS antiporter qdr3, partial [Scheffersomyces spartinae]